MPPCVFPRSAYAYIFGRDGGLSKIDMLQDKLDKRIIQAGTASAERFPGWQVNRRIQLHARRR